jgi:hypothetical protein
MKKKMDTKTGAIMLIAVAVVAGLIIYAFLRTPATPSGSGPSGPLPTYAPQGQLVAGFPSQLILEPQAQISQSYSLSGEVVAEWNSSTSIDDLYNEYQNYFSSNGWNILNETAAPSNVRGISAQNSSGSVNFTATTQPDGSSDVTVSYLPQS